MRMNKDERDKLGQWILNNWQENGGLLIQKHAASIIGISENSVRVAAEAGRLKCIQLGKTKLYPFLDVIAFKSKRDALKNGQSKTNFVKNIESLEKYLEANLSDEDAENLMDEFTNLIETSMEKFIEKLKKD